MTATARLGLYSLAVLGWAAVLLYFYGSGRVVKYLAPDFRILCLAGGLGLAVLGLFTLLTARHAAGCGHAHGPGDDPCGAGGGPHDHDHHDHGSDLNPWLALVVMVMPLALAVGMTRDGYSQAALARKGLYDPLPATSSLFFTENLPPLTREQVEAQHRKDAQGYHEFNLLELFFATGDRELHEILEGMKVRTEGRIVDEPGQEIETRKRLYRLFITCCAADSRAIPIVVEFGGPPPAIEPNSWVVARGTIRFPLEGGRLLPVLDADDAAPAEAPWEESFMRGGF